MRGDWRRLGALAMIAAGVLVASARRADAQLGSLLSPGPLSKAHADLEGITNCEKCHEPGNRKAADRCLSCHKPIAERIKARVGVHRNVTDDCGACHAEHAGRDAELRPFDEAHFRHAEETGFALDGKHAPVAAKCSACHKGRSFLDASPACASCHDDPHKGELGAKCERCHSTKVAFKATRQSFDHTQTAFPLTGAHRTVACSACHSESTFGSVAFASCTSCHVSPHETGTVSASCTACHTTATWTTREFDHSRTAFPLLGKHASVACGSCHKESAIKVRPASSTCATCHADPHRGEFAQDCKACHDERGFTSARFDHAAATGFALVDGHARVACRACHTSVTQDVAAASAVADFRGAETACASCHADPHRGELGQACETCHSPRTFRVTAFTHPRAQELFAGQHATLRCDQCHKPALVPASAATPARMAMAGGRFTATPTACASCHEDVHRGQVGTACQTCHTVRGDHFAPDAFSHERTSFRLTGAHAALACDKCHATSTTAPAAGSGTTTQLAGIGTACATCHKDVHLGQVGRACDTCHDTRAFKLTAYTHRKAPKDFFVGPHRKAPCEACHKTKTGRFPAGRGTAINFTIGTACTGCHEDVHHGAMGASCGDCHRLAALRPSGAPEIYLARFSTADPVVSYQAGRP